MRAWISKYLMYLPVQAIRREPVSRHRRDLERLQWESSAALEAMRLGRLKDLLAHASRNIPYYRDAFRAHGADPEAFRSLDDLRRFPVLEKSSVRAEPRRLISETLAGRLDPRKTSGSTGIPVPTFKTRDAYARIRAIWYRYAHWYGIDIGDRQGRFLGHPVTWRGVLREDIQDFILNKDRLDPVYLTPERMLEYWKRIRRRNLVYIYGYASAVVAFTRFLLERGEDPRESGVRAILCTGETLYDFQKEYLENVYGIPVVNEYGCTESGVLAFPCPEAGRMHLSVDNVHIEFMAGDRPARPGEAGEVLITDLYSPEAPLIRYRLGDVAVPAEAAPCACGRGLPMIERVEGRTSQMFTLPDGRQVHSEVFAYINDAIAELDESVRAFRVRRRGPASFVVQLVTSGELKPQTVQRLREIVGRVLGESTALDVECVSELPRDPGGKLRYFIDDTAPPPQHGRGA